MNIQQYQQYFQQCMQQVQQIELQVATFTQQGAQFATNRYLREIYAILLQMLSRMFEYWSKQARVLTLDELKLENDITKLLAKIS